MVTVTAPNRAYRDAFLHMVEDYAQNDPKNGEFYKDASIDFAAYVQRLKNDEQGIDLGEGRVPCSHRWLMVDADTVAGVVRIRHNIDTPFLAIEAGHIGYDVAPSRRGRGYGIAALQAGIQEARELGLERVLVCADSDNTPSWRTIERCGGILETELMSEHYGCLFRRYWISL